MTDERDQENQEKPKIHVVDRRGISDEKEPKEEEETKAPKLEMISGGASEKAEPEPQQNEEMPSEEEMEQMRAELEEEQFETVSKQLGRPLTEKEKESVREEMKRQAEVAMRLEATPMLVQTMSELSGRAAVHLGLMPNPYTKVVARNDAEARLAIDAIAALYDLTKFKLDAPTGKEINRVLNDLRANYANITGKQAPTQGGPRIIQ